MKAIKLSVLAAMMLTAGITTVRAQNADEIIQKHIDAIGGTDNWNKIKSMKRIGNISAQGMEISYTAIVVNDKGMRTDFSLMGVNNYIILTPKEGWMYMPAQGMDKVTALPPEQMKGSMEQLNVKAGMLTDKKDIAKAEYVGKDTINNIACYKVKVTDKDGNVKTHFFDASTYYLLRTEATIKAQDAEQEVSLNYSDFKKQPEGIVIPMSMTAPGGQGDIITKTVEINKTVDDNTFKPDAAPAADKK